jgi:hypothetical protein
MTGLRHGDPHDTAHQGLRASGDDVADLGGL